MADLGTDISCVSDVDPQCTVVSGRRLLAEAVARRWITPRGMLIDDPNYGTDVTDFIDADVTRASLASMRASMIAEALKDERVESCEVVITPPPGGLGATGAYHVTATLADAAGPFDLTLAITDVTVDLIEVTP